MLYHLAVDGAWRDGEAYGWSMPGVPLADVGFVHCSFAEQVDPTYERWYAGRTDLVLLAVDPGRLTSPVRVEDGFPHVYGPIDAAAVVSVEPYGPATGS